MKFWQKQVTLQIRYELHDIWWKFFVWKLFYYFFLWVFQNVLKHLPIVLITCCCPHCSLVGLCFCSNLLFCWIRPILKWLLYAQFGSHGDNFDSKKERFWDLVLLFSPQLHFGSHEDASSLARALQWSQCLKHQSQWVLPEGKVSNRDESVDGQDDRHNPRISM